MIDIPIWGLIMISLVSLILLFILFKASGVLWMYSIGLSLLLTTVLMVILHPFDVRNGILVQHPGDLYTSCFIASSIIYFIILGLYMSLKRVILEKCCCKTYDTIDLRKSYEPISIPIKDRPVKPIDILDKLLLIPDRQVKPIDIPDKLLLIPDLHDDPEEVINMDLPLNPASIKKSANIDIPYKSVISTVTNNEYEREKMSGTLI